MRTQRNTRHAAGALVLTLAVLTSSAAGTSYIPGSSSTPEHGDFKAYGSKWGVGGGTSSVTSFNTSNPPGTPGGATFSIMSGNILPYDSDDDHYDDGDPTSTSPITDLGVNSFTLSDYVDTIDSAMDVWAAVSGFTNLGYVTDGGGRSGYDDTGDIRIAAQGFPGDSAGNKLAHAYYPSPHVLGGDMHIDTGHLWVDDPSDGSGYDYDLFSVVLHEFGHSLGLRHSEEEDAVMWPYLGAARRELHADDIAGIQAIYGPVSVVVPAPAGVGTGIFGILLLGIFGYRGRRAAAHESEAIT